MPPLDRSRVYADVIRIAPGLPLWGITVRHKTPDLLHQTTAPLGLVVGTRDRARRIARRRLRAWADRIDVRAAEARDRSRRAPGEGR